MKILLDSWAFIDIYLDAFNLTDEAKNSFQSNEAEIFFSVATLLEIGLNEALAFLKKSIVCKL